MCQLPQTHRPAGLCLENFDPVGQWRDTWPDSDTKIDAAVALSDGTKINDVVDRKKWLVRNEDIFATNLARKLMIYGTGRNLNYVEEKEVAAIVHSNLADNKGFRDLILRLIISETLRTK